MWQLGRDTIHVPAGLDYPRGGRLVIDQDPVGQTRGYDKQFLPYCRYGDIVLLEEKIVSNSQIGWQYI